MKSAPQSRLTDQGLEELSDAIDSAFAADIAGSKAKALEAFAREAEATEIVGASKRTRLSLILLKHLIESLCKTRKPLKTGTFVPSAGSF